MAVQTVFLCPVRWAGALLLLTLWQSLALGAGTLTPTNLRQGDSLDGRCSTKGATHDLHLNSGEYVRAWLEPHGILAARLLGPSGRVIVAAELGPDAAVPLSLVADRTGTYELAVRCDTQLASSPSFRLYLEIQRSAFESDIQRVKTERAFLLAGGLAQDWREQPRRRAVERLQHVLGSSKRIGDPMLEARALTFLGDLHRSLGEARKALNYYEQALSVEQNHSLQIDAHLGAARAHLRLDERDRASQHTTEVLNLNQKFGDERALARSLTTLGIVRYDLEEFMEAIDSIQQALSVWKRLGDKRGESEARMNLGFAYSELSEEQKAIEIHHMALDLARDIADKRMEALTLTALGHVHSKRGEKQLALNFYYQASPLLDAMGDSYWTASLYSGIAYVHAELGDTETAIAYYTRTVSLNQRISSIHGQAASLILLGRVHFSVGQTEKALACYRTALALFGQLRKPRMEAVALGGIAKAYGALGRDAEALDYYTRALAHYEASGFKREEANTLNNVGRIEERRGRVEAAVDHYRRALALSRETHDRFVESQSLLNLARIARAAGDLDLARQHAEEALGLAERLREDVASYSLRASYFASIHEHHEFYVDLLMELNRERPSKAFDLLAFRASEKARARSLLEMLSEDPPDPSALDTELVEREKQLERNIRAHAGAWEQRAGRAADGKPPNGSSTEVSELLAELDRVRAVIRSQSDRAQPLETETASMEELQEQLDSSTLLLSYFLGSERSYLWALTRWDLSVHVLPPREEIETRVQHLYRLLTARERKQGETAKEFYERARESDRQFWEGALPLSRTLLGPVAGKLETKRLVIVGDGALHHFPFSALPIPTRPSDADPLPLIAEHEIVRLPSASIPVALRTRGRARPEPRKTVAILADPVFDREDPRVERPHAKKQEPGMPVATVFPVSRSAGELFRALKQVRLGEGGIVPRLLASRQEAQGILSLVPPEESLAALGFEASRALATSGELTRYRVIHFATHGILNTEHPELSGIILSMVDENGKPRDGFLRLHDIETLDLPVDLVVLSACSTGLGKEVKGEGMIGLVRGFMSAGADRVLASYWNVDDEATAELMERFYRNLFTKGLAPSAALREAQRSMWTEKRWRSPFYWAAFELQGQWQ